MSNGGSWMARSQYVLHLVECRSLFESALFQEWGLRSIVASSSPVINERWETLGPQMPVRGPGGVPFSLPFPPHLRIHLRSLPQCYPQHLSFEFCRWKTQIYITSSSTWYKPTPIEARSCASFLRRLQSSSCAGGRCFSDIVFAKSPNGPWRNWSSSMTLS